MNEADHIYIYMCVCTENRWGQHFFVKTSSLFRLKLTTPGRFTDGSSHEPRAMEPPPYSQLSSFYLGKIKKKYKPDSSINATYYEYMKANKIVRSTLIFESTVLHLLYTLLFKINLFSIKLIFNLSDSTKVCDDTIKIKKHSF